MTTSNRVLTTRYMQAWLYGPAGVLMTIMSTFKVIVISEPGKDFIQETRPTINNPNDHEPSPFIEVR